MIAMAIWHHLADDNFAQQRLGLMRNCGSVGCAPFADGYFRRVKWNPYKWPKINAWGFRAPINGLIKENGFNWGEISPYL